MSSHTLLLMAMAAIALIWRLPRGQLIFDPFSLPATVAHELGVGPQVTQVKGSGLAIK